MKGQEKTLKGVKEVANYSLKNQDLSYKHSQKGITLIALVVTIIVLLILAGVTIITLFGENGLINMADKSKEANEIAQIKEKADFVKIGLNIDAVTNQNGVSFIEKSKLISELKKNFEGSKIEEGRVVVKGGKYDIIVKDNLDIVVVKHGENALKDDEIKITYEIEDIDMYSKKVKVYLEVGGKMQTPTEEGYTQFENEYLSNKSTAELEELVLKSEGYIGTFDQYLTDKSMTREQFEQMAQEQEMAYDEYLKWELTEGVVRKSWVEVEHLVQLAGGEGKTQTGLENLYVELIEYPGTFDEFLTKGGITRDDLPTIAQQGGFRTEEDFIKYLVASTYMNKLDATINEPITVQCSNGDSKTTNVLEAYVEFTLTESGTYTIVATTESGKRGETNLEIAVATPPITAEKLNTVLSTTSNTKLLDKYGNKITVPAGFKIVKPTAENKVEYTYSGDGVPAVQDGIVIENATDGNQFVWVPVGTINNKSGDSRGTTTTIKLGRYSNFTVTNGVLPTPAQEATGGGYNTQVPIETYYIERASSDLGNTTAVDLQEWITTTLANGGYYIARYEARKNDDTNPTKAASIAGNTVWTNIYQTTAAEKARATYPAPENTKTGYSFYSDLINSYAWDTAIVFIEAYANSTYASTNNNKNEENIETFMTTGANTDNVCNINAMSGNAFEWSTETSTTSGTGSTYPCTLRGGSYYTNLDGSSGCALSRWFEDTYFKHYGGGSFRITLYVE